MSDNASPARNDAAEDTSTHPFDRLMSSASTPAAQTPDAGFSTAFRGYDKDEVDAAIAGLNARVRAATDGTARDRRRKTDIPAAVRNALFRRRPSRYARPQGNRGQRMARRSSGMDVVASLPWPMGIGLGIAGHFAIRYGVPAWFAHAGGPMGQAMAKQADLLAPSSRVAAGIRLTNRLLRRFLKQKTGKSAFDPEQTSDAQLSGDHGAQGLVGGPFAGRVS